MDYEFIVLRRRHRSVGWDARLPRYLADVRHPRTAGWGSSLERIAATAPTAGRVLVEWDGPASIVAPGFVRPAHHYTTPRSTWTLPCKPSSGLGSNGVTSVCWATAASVFAR